MTAHTSPASIAQVAALVVTWHNRHVLARRIAPEHVQGVGIVAMPFVGDRSAAPIEPALEAAAPVPVGSLRERALAVAARPAGEGGPPPLQKQVERLPKWKFWARPRPAFNEDFVAPIPAAAAGRFGACHASLDEPAGTWMRRDVIVDGLLLAGRAPQWRYLRTAAIEFEGMRRRVLVAADGSGAVLGQRVWSRPRVAMAALLPVALVGMMLVGRIDLPQGSGALPHEAIAQRPAASGAVGVAVAQPTPSPAPKAGASTVAAVASSAAPPSLPRDHSVVEVPRDRAAAAAPQLPVQSAPAASVPRQTAVPSHAASPPVETRADAVRVDIRPRLDPEIARAARRESAALRNAGTMVSVTARPAASAAVRSPPPRSDDGRTFALVARQTRTRAASEVLLGLMRTTAAQAPAGSMRTEVLPSAEGYRASWWPFGTRDDAEQARLRLARLGLPVDLVEF